jgi:hypothetical protein
MALNNVETKNTFEIDESIKKFKQEIKTLWKEIEYKKPEEIWWYKILESYKWFLTKNEKWFAIELANGEYWADDLNIAIIVKINKWKIQISDTQQWLYTIDGFQDIELSNKETSTNKYINLINRAIKSMWFNTINNEKGDINKLLKLIEDLEK